MRVRNTLKIISVIFVVVFFFTWIFLCEVKGEEYNAKVILNTSFEEYPIETLPDSFRIKYDGKGSSYQVVTDVKAFSGSHSLQIWGVPHWCANIHYDFNVFANKYVEISWKMFATENNNGWISFINENGATWGWGYCGIGFSGKDGKFRICDDSGCEYYDSSKIPIKINDWNDLKVILNTQSTECIAFINNVKVYKCIIKFKSGKRECDFYFLDGTTKHYERTDSNPRAYYHLHGIRLGDCASERGYEGDPTYFDDLKIVGYNFNPLTKYYFQKPPYLEITSIKLWDEDGDRVFEAGERGTLVIKIANYGKGSAYDLKLKVKSPIFEKSLSISEIKPGEEIIREIDFNIPLRVKTGGNYVKVFLDAGKYSPEPVKIVFTTKAPLPPKFKIAYKIDDDRVGESIGNGNGIIEPRETVELVVKVSNVGKGEARDVKLVLNSPDVDVIKGAAELGTLPPGASTTGKLVFFVPSNIKKREIVLYLEIKESLKLFNTKVKLAFNVGKSREKIYNYAVESGESFTRSFNDVPFVEIKIERERKSSCIKPNPNYYFFGVVVYDYATISDLNYVKNDKILIKKLATCYMGVPEENMKILENPSYALLKRELRHFTKKIIRKDAILYFYYSGHGVLDSKGKFYILPFDASIDDEESLRESSIDIDTLKRLLAKAKGRKIALIDACRIEPSWKPAVLIYKPKLTDMAIIFSTKEGQTSNVDRDRQYSAFTRAIYEMAKAGIINLDMDCDGYVEIKEIEKPLIKWIKRISADERQMPDFWGIKEMPLFPVE